MMHRHFWVWVVLCLAGAGSWCAAAEDDPKKIFDDLFGADVKRAQSSPTGADDAELASRLMEAVDAASERPGLVAVICRTAADLGARDPAGHETAVNAYTRLMSLEPEQAPAHAMAIVELRNKQMLAAKGEARKDAAAAYVEALLDAADRYEAAGDVGNALTQVRQAARSVASAGSESLKADVAERQRLLTAKQMALNTIDKLKQKLKLNPDDQASAEELVRVCVVDLDDPAEAFKYTLLVQDEKLKANVKTASRELDAITAAEALDAGSWYLSLSAGARDPQQKLAMLDRAAVYYDHFLEKDKTEGLLRTKASIERKRVTDESAAIRQQLVRQVGGDWIDVVGKWTKGEYHSHGWSKRGEAIVVGTAEDRVLKLPSRPADKSYEYKVRLARMDDPGMIGIVFAVPGTTDAERTCTFVAQGANGKFSGLERLDGQTYASNASTGGGGFLPINRKVTLAVRVETLAPDKVKVSAYINGAKRCQFIGSPARLSNYYGWTDTDGCLGVVANYASVAVFEASYRKLP